MNNSTDPIESLFERIRTAIAVPSASEFRAMMDRAHSRSAEKKIASPFAPRIFSRKIFLAGSVVGLVLCAMLVVIIPKVSHPSNSVDDVVSPMVSDLLNQADQDAAMTDQEPDYHDVQNVPVLPTTNS